MDQQVLITRIVASLEPDPRVRALFLSGSFGRGTADAYSDVDLLAVTPAEAHEAMAADWRGVMEAIAPIVHWNRLPHALVLNAITDTWLRCDIQIVGPDNLGGRAQDRLKVLIDRDGIFGALPTTLPHQGVDPGRMRAMITEFIRVLGLLPVADGRGEYEVGVFGSSLLRRMLTDLLVAEMDVGDTGGALHLSRVLNAERMALLLALPVARPNRTSVIEANLATARLFMPRAKELAAKLGIEWPQDFEAATRRVLTKALPAFHVDW
jgi:hypothetical protein